MKVPTHLKIHDWGKSLVWIDEDGIVFVLTKTENVPEEDPTREEVLRMLEEYKEITNYQKRCLIIEGNSRKKTPNKEQRDYTEKIMNDITKALAIVSTSPLSRMLANLYFGFKPPQFPVKFFENETDAKEWIKQYL